MPDPGGAPGAQSIVLSDGRTLGFAEYGDPGGRPILFNHGLPGSRLLGRALDCAAKRTDVRLIAPERPGCGQSSYLANRTIGMWPADLVQLADKLGLERFAMLGFSAGGPYTAACARHIPERLTRISIVCGMAPPDGIRHAQGMRLGYRAGFALAQHSPWLALRVWDGVGHFFRSLRPRMGWKFDVELSPTDRAVLATTDLPDLLVADVVEAFRMGSRGPGLEALLLTREWDFRLEDIQAEVHLWQAGMDTSVPPGLAHYQASRLPRCQLTMCPEEGHFSMLVRRMDEVLRDVAREAP